jgi:Uma2 family endonuclease
MAVTERDLSQGKLTESVFKDEELKPQPYRWSRAQFYEMGETGLFEGQKAILMEGEILVMPPMNPPHQGVITIVADLLRTAFGAGYVIREQGPFNVGMDTDPEPDIAVVRGQMRDFLLMHPTTAALIVEVSWSTLRYDRREKASLYAKSGIPEYWIINIEQDSPQVEVHRRPMRDEEQVYGFGYGERIIHLAGELIQPLNTAKPVAVTALLP